MAQDLKSGQRLALQHFQKGATTGGDVAHVLLDAVLGDGREGVAATGDAEGRTGRNRCPLYTTDASDEVRRVTDVWRQVM